jgi:hypothetical protein
LFILGFQNILHLVFNLSLYFAFLEEATKFFRFSDLVSTISLLTLLLGAGNGGVGLFALTFDWYYIGTAMITTPFRFAMNYIFGRTMFLYIIIPILFYKNAFREDKAARNHISSSPFGGVLNTNSLFNSTGDRISAVSLYDPVTYNLNVTKYEENAPIYITEMFASKFYNILTFQWIIF